MREHYTAISAFRSVLNQTWWLNLVCPTYPVFCRSVYLIHRDHCKKRSRLVMSALQALSVCRLLYFFQASLWRITISWNCLSRCRHYLHSCGQNGYMTGGGYMKISCRQKSEWVRFRSVGLACVTSVHFQCDSLFNSIKCWKQVCAVNVYWEGCIWTPACFDCQKTEQVCTKLWVISRQIQLFIV